MTDEFGRLVFTREFHLRRGYCCGNGCKHCPYGRVNVRKRRANKLLTTASRNI